MSTEIELVPFALGDGSGVMVCCAEDAMDIIAQRDARIAELEARVEHYNKSILGMNQAHWRVVQELAALKSQPSAVHLLFDGPPGPECGRFVEAEDASGRSINAGEWSRRPDGYWQLVIQRPCTGDLLAKIAELEQSVEVATTECVQQYRWRLENNECGRDEINDGVDMLLARLKAQQPGTQVWPKQQCPVTGAVTDVDPADMGGQQPSAGVAQGIDIDAAAKALAQCMDYPWDFMPERGREAMREHVRSVIGAARLNPCRAQAVPDGYVLVPVDPTPEMLDRYPFNVSAATSEPMGKEDLRVVYQAMLAAAPPSQQKES